MKSYILLFCLLIVGNATFATIRTVSNDPNSPGQYTTIAAAITAAVNGDTIYIHGTNINYGSITINKSLTIIGSSHNPQNQNVSRSIVNAVTLQAGSSNSRIIGMVIGSISASAITDVTISRNYLSGVLDVSGASPNWRIESNVFATSGPNIDLHSSTTAINWYLIKNVFNGQLTYFNAAYIYFYNNLFLRSADAFYSMNYAYFYNNIFYRANPIYNVGPSIFERNLSYQCGNNNFPNGTNLVGVDPKFVSFPGAGAYFDYAHNYRLQVGSPCIDYDIDGEDIGLYGGLIGHYEQNGVPNIPQMREFNLTSTSTVPVGGSINFNVKSTIRP